MINARSETVLTKAAFRDDFIKQRCLIPVVGFYEWNEKKEQFRFTSGDELFYLGGFFHRQAEGFDEFVIMTKAPVKLVAEVHNRMTVVIPADQGRDFLDAPETALKIISENQVILKKDFIQGEKQYSFIDLLANDVPHRSDHDEQ